VKVIGLDIALNHGAAIELTDGKLSNWWFYTDMAGVADKGKKRATRLQLNVKDRQHRQMTRLAQVEHWLDKTILVPNRPDYVGVEDYAIRAEQGAHYIGEIGGIARILLWFRGIPFRLHDPTSVKMFATHDGTAQKDAIERAVKSRWGADFSEVNMPKPPRAKKQNRVTSEDLADAFAIAKLVSTEYAIRSGDMTTKDLEHDKERRVFNRVTKTYPTSLLDREWIQNPSLGAPTPHGALRKRIEAEIARVSHKPQLANYLKGLLKDG
jgi:Holliday junction resolvasome RuvABC endonuclease subunit